MSLVAAKSVTKRYESGGHTVTALDEVSFEVQPGERVALVGASGSGKTTLLNLLAGLDRPTSGELHVGELQLSQLNEQQLAAYRSQNIGVIFQAFHLLLQQTALQNVELPLIVQGIVKQARRKLAMQALDRVGLSHRMTHRPSALSGGEQQRVAIARAIVHRPKLILADEPTGNLDTKNTLQILDLIQELLSEHDTSMVLITHDMKLAERCSTRIVWMSDGKLQQDDPHAAS